MDPIGLALVSGFEVSERSLSPRDALFYDSAFLLWAEPSPSVWDLPTVKRFLRKSETSRHNADDSLEVKTERRHVVRFLTKWPCYSTISAHSRAVAAAACAT
jgi:hypothetical protein